MAAFRLMFYGGLVLAIIFLIAAVVIFFVLDIPKALGVVTGSTQRKAIEEINAGGTPDSKKQKKNHISAREIATGGLSSKDSGSKRNSAGNLKHAENGQKIQEAETEPENIKKSFHGSDGEDEATELLSFTKVDTEDNESTEVLGTDDETTDVLSSENSTFSEEKDINYNDGKTDVLNSKDSENFETEDENKAEIHMVGETSMYGSTAADQTSVLVADMATGTANTDTSASHIKILYKETVIHTDETL